MTHLLEKSLSGYQEKLRYVVDDIDCWFKVSERHYKQPNAHGPQKRTLFNVESFII